MPAFICTACGTQYPPSEAPPASCSICAEDRQFVPPEGQTWTTLDRLGGDHANAWRRHEPRLLSIITAPSFAIGQRAFLIQSPHGNVLWDCLALLDEATIALIRALGGLAAIAISHPHFYATMAEWAAAFEAPIHLHAADRKWVMRPNGSIVFWDGDEASIAPGLTLIHCGGHFAGGTVLLWADGADGRGALLSGDILQVTADRSHLSFMRSYPNLTPLSGAVVQRIAARLAARSFDRVHGAFADRTIEADAKAALARSADRYVRAVSGEGPADREMAGRSLESPSTLHPGPRARSASRDPGSNG